MSRIVAPSELELNRPCSGESEGVNHVASLHDHTYGITSDPLIQFACAFAALIHDVDHMGVPNVRLVEENPQLGQLYRNRSVAEQNSLELAWSLLHQKDKFQKLRQTLYTTQTELDRFRALVVNCVMATDIVDRDLKELRNGRWDKAFKGEHKETPRDATNRKATIVIEHLIQASDVAHTMQHWHVYRKWNERLFSEIYKAWKAVSISSSEKAKTLCKGITHACSGPGGRRPLSHMGEGGDWFLRLLHYPFGKEAQGLRCFRYF